MSMYTGLRFKAKIKKEYEEALTELLESEASWEMMALWYPNQSVWKEMNGVYKADFIPFGHMEIPEWLEENTMGGNPSFTPYEWIRSFQNGILTFQCSLNNSQRTIEHFLEKVVPILCEEIIHIETYYEGDSMSKVIQ